MSEQIHYKIKLEKKLKNETLQEQCKRILIENNIDVKNENNYINTLCNNLYQDYVIKRDNIYKILSVKEITSCTQ